MRLSFSRSVLCWLVSWTDDRGEGRNEIEGIELSLIAGFESESWGPVNAILELRLCVFEGYFMF